MYNKIFFQNHWEKEYEITSSHKFRKTDDIQYSYAYYQYLIEYSDKNKDIDLYKIFNTYWDSNKDGYIDDNELLTLYSMITTDITEVKEKEYLTKIYMCLTNTYNLTDEYDIFDIDDEYIRYNNS